MFTKANGILFVTVLAATMVGLALHQTVTSPLLVKKPKPAAGGKQ